MDFQVSCRSSDATNFLTGAQEIMMFLQALPTKDWTEKDIELLLSEAFIWQSLFQGSSAHLRSAHTTAAATTPHA